MAYRFEWDEHKARSNRGKHGITFDEASSVFDDLLAKIFMMNPTQARSVGKLLWVTQ
jgi:uncharacterized protein